MTSRMTGTQRLTTAALIVAAIAFPTGAAAQDKVAVTLGAGGMFNRDPFPGTRFTEPLVSGSIQRVFLRFLVLEGDLTYWQHVYRREVGPHNVTGPSGVIGRVDNTVVIDDRKTWTVGLNALVRSTGAVRVFGGAGVGLVTQDTVYSQTETGCVGFGQPLICNPYVIERVRGPLPNVRVIGGVEVPVGTRLAIVGTVRGELSDLDDRNRAVVAVAGVRFSLR
jgi:hypothetical protein